MRKYLKELKTEDLDFPVKGTASVRAFEMRKAGRPLVLGHNEGEAW